MLEITLTCQHTKTKLRRLIHNNLHHDKHLYENITYQCKLENALNLLKRYSKEKNITCGIYWNHNVYIVNNDSIKENYFLKTGDSIDTILPLLSDIKKPKPVKTVKNITI